MLETSVDLLYYRAYINDLNIPNSPTFAALPIAYIGTLETTNDLQYYRNYLGGI